MLMNKIRVLIADDHAILRTGLKSLFSTQKDIEVVGEASDGTTAIELTGQKHPNVVLMDLSMPGMYGVEATAELVKRHPDVNVLILTTFGTSDSIDRALKSGASGAILKTADFSELLAAIRKVSAGEKYVSPDIEQILADDPPLPTLSQRQRDVLESITRGLSNTDIAKQLGISVGMVKEHVMALYAKIGAANRSEAVSIAIRKHLI